MKDKMGRIDRALEKLSGHETECALCPRECRVDRTGGAAGICQTGSAAAVSRALLHYGEEPAISGYSDWTQAKAKKNVRGGGSGTIFFTGCNLKCLFCQNYQLSWLMEGKEVSDQELADLMLGLQDQGALNINLVSPSHVIPPILRALRLAYSRGLDLPVVYNSNGYEKADVIRLLEGVIDLYLPDLKYFSPAISQKFSGAADYFRWASAAVEEMYLQQPALVLDEEEIARHGLILRHLVLPGQVEDSLAVLEWVRRSLSAAVCLSLMSQYHPCFRAPQELRRDLTPGEYETVVCRAQKLGFERLFTQPVRFKSDQHLVPDFRRNDPFRWE